MGKTYLVNTEQIRMMKHCIGFEKSRIKGTKYRKMEAYRNYFTTADDDELLDSMVEQGLMEKGKFERGIGNNPQWYSVTEEGLKFISELTSIEISIMK